MGRKLTILIAVFFFSQGLNAQDAVFSQFFNATLYLNPALAGLNQTISVNLNHRSQWNSLRFPYTTSQVSMIYPLFRDKHAKPFGHIGGVGVSVFNDFAGENNNLKTTGGNVAFSYVLPFDKHYVNQIMLGVQAGAIQKRVDPNQLRWGEQYNPFIGFDASVTPAEVALLQNKTVLDINAGFFWLHNPLPEEQGVIRGINSGLAVSHLNNPNESLLEEDQSRLPLLYKYHGGILFGISPKARVSANALIAYQNNESQYNLGSYLSYDFLGNGPGLFNAVTVRLGGWYRVQDAAIVLTEFETSKFKFAFSYDWNTSSLRYRNLGIGTYEFHLAIHIAGEEPPKNRY